MDRPQASEYNEYYSLYADQVPDGDIFEILESSLEATLQLLRGLDLSWASYRYAPEKWSLNEVVGHVVDVERTFGFRAFAIARAEPAALPSFDQDHYARESRANERPLGAWLEELDLVRRSHLLLFRSFDEATSLRHGTASGFEFSVRSFPYIIAGHEIHHRKVLEERYLKPLREAV